MVRAQQYGGERTPPSVNCTDVCDIRSFSPNIKTWQRARALRTQLRQPSRGAWPEPTHARIKSCSRARARALDGLSEKKRKFDHQSRTDGFGSAVHAAQGLLLCAFTPQIWRCWCRLRAPGGGEKSILSPKRNPTKRTKCFGKWLEINSLFHSSQKCREFKL